MGLDYFYNGEIEVLYGLHRANNIKEDLEKNIFPSEMPISMIPVLIPLPPFTKKLNAKIADLDIKSKIPEYKHTSFQKC